MSSRKANRKKRQLFLFVKLSGKHGGVSLHLKTRPALINKHLQAKQMAENLVENL